MRILIITEDDPIYVVRFFETFFAEVDPQTVEIVGLTISSAFDEPLVKTGMRLLRFYGPVGFARLLARFCAAKIGRRSIETLATEHGVPILATKSVNAPDYVERVRHLAPDVIVSVAAPEIFRPPLLESAGRRCINIHSGRLPKYRGMMPVFWQMSGGEAEVTVTIHDMVEQLDAGAVLATKAFPIRAEDTLDRMIVETKEGGARLMLETLARLDSDELTPVPLDMTSSSYFSFPTRADVVAFRDQGHRLL